MVPRSVILRLHQTAPTRMWMALCWQLSDIHFGEVRTTVLAMIKGQSAVVLTADGSEIHLGRSELEEMRKVLSAYLHLQT